MGSLVGAGARVFPSEAEPFPVEKGVVRHQIPRHLTDTDQADLMGQILEPLLHQNRVAVTFQIEISLDDPVPKGGIRVDIRRKDVVGAQEGQRGGAGQDLDVGRRRSLLVGPVRVEHLSRLEGSHEDAHPIRVAALALDGFPDEGPEFFLGRDRGGRAGATFLALGREGGAHAGEQQTEPDRRREEEMEQPASSLHGKSEMGQTIQHADISISFRGRSSRTITARKSLGSASLRPGGQ